MKHRLYEVFNILSSVIIGLLFIIFFLGLDIDVGTSVVKEIQLDGWIAVFGAMIAGALVGVIGGIFFALVSWLIKKTLKKKV